MLASRSNSYPAIPRTRQYQFNRSGVKVLTRRNKSQEARSESRFVTDVPLRLLGVDERNTVFNDETQSQNVSRHGVCFRSKRRITPGNVVSIRSFDSSKWSAPVVFQIRWVDDSSGRYLHGGLLKDDGEWAASLCRLGLLSTQDN